MASYADVLKPEPQPLWPKLQDFLWLSKLHAKFWGKSIDHDKLGFDCHKFGKEDLLCFIIHTLLSPILAY